LLSVLKSITSTTVVRCKLFAESQQQTTITSVCNGLHSTDEYIDRKITEVISLRLLW